MKRSRRGPRHAARLAPAAGALLATGVGLAACIVHATAAPTATAFAAEPAAAPKTIAITIDDLPGVGRDTGLARLVETNKKMLGALARRKVPAIGFVNEGRLQVAGERDERVAILRDWLDAGMDLGNHTFGHLGLTDTPLADYEDDVVRGDVVLRALLQERGRRPAFFRHPYTQTGPSEKTKIALEEFLGARGYRTAPFTIEDSDYMFNALYEDALAQGDTARATRVREAFVAHQATMLDWFEGLARDMFGRDIPQILLIHVDALNAETLDGRLAMLAARGYRFVPLREALADAAYATPDRFVGPNGPSWLHRWTVAKGMPMRLREEPDPPTWVLEAWRGIMPPRARATS